MIVQNCQFFETASLPALAELLVWNWPGLMTISKHECFQGRKQSVKVGWDVAALPSPPGSSGPEHVKAVMVSGRWGLMF